MKNYKKIIRITLVSVFVFSLLVVFLSHRLTASQVESRLEKIDISQLLIDVGALHKDGVIKAHVKISPLPNTLQKLGVQKIYMGENGLHLILDEFFVTETGLLIANNVNLTCKAFLSPYCKKLQSRMFYYHKLGL